MAKWSGFIGYSKTEETRPGVWVEKSFEKRHFGDIVRDNRRYETSQNQINDNLTLSNSISVVSNKFISENLSYMKYITFMNSKWKISSVELKPPRIILTIGGLYNEG